jgi:hypothetical protein
MSDPMQGDASPQGFLRKVLTPEYSLGGHRELGSTALARHLDLPDHQLSGHWCSRCQGIWYGCMLEVECPCCGNRRG